MDQLADRPAHKGHPGEVSTTSAQRYARVVRAGWEGRMLGFGCLLAMPPTRAYSPDEADLDRKRCEACGAPPGQPCSSNCPARRER